MLWYLFRSVPWRRIWFLLQAAGLVLTFLIVVVPIGLVLMTRGLSIMVTNYLEAIRLQIERVFKMRPGTAGLIVMYALSLKQVVTATEQDRKCGECNGGGSKNNCICDLKGVMYADPRFPGAVHAEPYLVLMTERTIYDKERTSR